MEKNRCDWCGKNFPVLREHSVDECTGQIEWNDWLDVLEESKVYYY